MVAGLQDLVDCARLADEAATLERIYGLGEMTRVKDLLVASRGTLAATFAFSKLSTGRPGVSVTIRAVAELVCQRCLKGFEMNVVGAGDIEFAAADEAARSDSDREYYEMRGGLVSLSDLAEEELLLALPIAPACTVPQTCGNAPSYASGVDARDPAGDLRRPFGGLQDLLKKT